MNPPTLISVCAFLKHYATAYRQATRERLLDFVGWYWRDGRVGIVRENGRIVAVAIGRCVQDVTRAQAEPYYHEEAAPIVWIDDIVSRHPHGVGLLFRQAMKRFGPRNAFSGQVFKRAGELRMLPYHCVARLAIDIPHHGLSLYSGATRAA